MDVTGKMTLFVTKQEGRDGKFNLYKGTISHKNEDGSRVNSSINVRFSKKFNIEDMNKKLKEDKCYEVEIKKAWLDTRVFTSKDGKEIHDIFIYVDEANFTKEKKITKGESSSLDFKVEE